MGKDYFTTASFGKRVEYVVIAKMLRSGLDVYLPMVDDKGIDCLVRMDGGSVAEIQIKGRSKNCEITSAGRYSALSIEPRSRYFIIFYSEACEDGALWLMPSLEFAKLARRNKGGKNEGKYSIVLCGAKTGKDGEKKPYALERFDKYRVRGDFSEDMFRE